MDCANCGQETNEDSYERNLNIFTSAQSLTECKNIPLNNRNSEATKMSIGDISKKINKINTQAFKHKYMKKK